jgi:hypothetical protein
MDATRISDGSFVMMKRVNPSDHPFEVKIGQFLSSPSLVSDSSNHCVRTLEVLEVPNETDETIIVMPLLRRFNDPPFETYGEAVDCIHQIFLVCCVVRSPSPRLVCYSGVEVYARPQRGA